MLKNSYIHIPRVGYITEKKIWNSGIKNWDQFDKVKLPSFRKKHISKFVDLSIDNPDRKIKRNLRKSSCANQFIGSSAKSY